MGAHPGLGRLREPAGGMTGPRSEAWALIRGFHSFLQHWLRGEGEPTLERIEDAVEPFDPDFLAIAPGGERQTRDQLVSWLQENWGRDPSLTVRLAAPELFWKSEEAVLLGYQEHQWGLRPSSRRAVALFDTSGGSSRWVHLSESWTSGA